MKTEEKTIAEWFEELPEPYKTKALDNVMSQNSVTLVSSDTSLSDALVGAFDWSITPEGFYFWNELDNSIKHEKSHVG